MQEDSGNGLLKRFLASEVNLEEVLNIAVKDDLDIWQVTPNHVDVYWPPPSVQSADSLVEDHLRDYPHSANVIPISAPRVLSASQTNNWTSSPSLSTFHEDYHPLHEIESFMSQLAQDYPALVQVIRVGISGEGRELLGVQIGSSPLQGKKSKGKSGEKERMGFVLTGAQHAREWVATSTTLYLMHALVANSTDNDSLISLLDHFTFYIIPTPNPDGYDYTWETDRFWYKNRMQTGPHSKCVGVDMNRNWGYKWRPTASFTNSSAALRPPPSTDTCSQWYPGNRAFEAPEVNHIAAYVDTLPNLKAFVDLRSYGQMISSPFSYSCNKTPKDAENQLEAALGAASAIRKAHGASFRTGPLCSTFYPAHGNIVDWMYKRAGIKYSYAAHLRDTGTYGFALPPRFIRAVGEETANMIEYISKFIVIVEK
jgi:extracellular matrix protein 14